MKQAGRFLSKYIKRNFGVFAIYMLLCILCSILSLIAPYISGNFIDVLLHIEQREQLVKYCVVFATMSFGSIACNYIISQIFARLRIKMNYEINMDFLHHIRKISILTLQKQTTASITQKLNYDTGIVTSFSLQTLQNILTNIITMILSLIALLHFSLDIGIILVCMLLVYSGTYIIFKKPLKHCNQEAREKETKYFSTLYKQLGYIKYIQMNCVDRFFDGLMKKSYVCLYKAGMRVQKIGFLFTSLDKIIMTIAQITLFFLGGIRVMEGILTIGEFTIISTYFSMILGAIRYFFGLGKSIQEMQVSLGRLINVMSIEEEKYGKKVIKHIQTIEVNNLDFVLDKRVILKNFSYKFRRGNIYGITGENGAGKSTLMNIITGMYWIPEAPIFINGVPIVKCDLGKMRRTSYGILEQEPILLEESIKDNIFLGGEDKSGSQKFIDITKLLGLDVFLKKLPNGLETIINENAMNLSGGEKQKLSLLRILLKDSEVLILDEPASALDTDSREQLYNYLNTIKRNSIIFIVTHDDKITDKVDHIINLSKNA